ncbi:MAG: Nif3-like dinuclear metal center hexameric protein [Kiritimatiellae bacterium]|nr:Nif3-like dinuclear metal center hexameric protein [Kiritimatiellia bacterium]
MKLADIAGWLDRTLRVADFDDVSNNGIQISRAGGDVRRVAFAVDASVRAVEAAAGLGAGLLVVHHGISWGGGIRRIDGGVYRVVRAAVEADVAVYACHLPLDAHPVLGNNAQLAKLLGLRRVRPAFSYHGNVIGVVGSSARARSAEVGGFRFEVPRGLVGVCSGGAGEFAEEAKRLGCALYLTGEASWGDVVAAGNCGMRMVCAGHYATEVFGVRAVAAAMRRALKLEVHDLTEELA